jgi:tetratricopeptide repeat protein
MKRNLLVSKIILSLSILFASIISASAQLKPDAFVYNNRGVAKGLKGDFDGAIADLTKAIELKPDFAFAYKGLQKGRCDGAQ